MTALDSPVILPSLSLIFLIGYRGTGKSTVARLLAGKLGWQMLDMDTVIEARQGRTIKHLFDEEGESAFRRLETELLNEVCLLTHHVIATGGGVILDRDNRSLLKKSGLVIWLTGKPATMWSRILQDVTTAERRPDLSVGGLAEIEQLLSIREPYYQECAAFTVVVDHRTADEVATSALQLVKAVPGSLSE